MPPQRKKKENKGKSKAQRSKPQPGKAQRGKVREARQKATRTDRPKAPRCRTCGRKITVPAGWSAGPAVRKHYWRVHRDVMTGSGEDA